MQKILFIDRDGTLVEEPSDYQIDQLEKIRFLPNVIPSLLALIQAGFRLVMVSNQDGLGTDCFPQSDFQRCHDFILTLLNSQGIEFSDIFICPHRVSDCCTCRKPQPGLLKQFLQINRIDLQQSWVIGDRESDKLLADHIGVGFLPISQNQGWDSVAKTLLYRNNTVHVTRNTRETSIEISLELESSQESCIKTPIGFFSHMLEQIAKHAGFSMQITAKGDTEVDDHHLVEDTALTLGEALKQALGDKRGIARYGFTLPMDESLASVTLDLCGRPYCRFEGQFTREFVGGLATEMIPHFFNSLAMALSACIHITVKGENHHHMIEACFKALGRSLGQAMIRQGVALPSTKGVL